MDEMHSKPERRFDGLALAVIALLVGFGYVLLEWLFFATKPSFMSSLSWAEKLQLLLAASLPSMMAVLIPCLAASLLARAIRWRWLSLGFLALAVMIPALVLTILGTLMLDNFTLTVFDFGIRDAFGYRRWLYAPVFILLFIVAFRWIWNRVRRRSVWSKSPATIAAVALLLTAGGAVGLSIPRTETFRTDIATGEGQGALPNIIILGSDGVGARNTTLYGYERQTTPFLNELGKHSLVCDNAFANASHTGASLVSMLTGKLPTETRVIYPPDILHGKDAYQHLPAILRQLGYRSIQISMRHYADVFDLNMRNSFDSVNSRSLDAGTLPPLLVALFGQDSCFLWTRMADRVESRVLHLVGVQPMTDVFAEVAQTTTKVSQTDRHRMKELIDFIDSTPAPFFAQVHLMKTHPGRYHPSERHFSHEGEDSTLVDAYDDCILGFDGMLRQLVDVLRTKGLYDRTILVIYSDHGPLFATNVRVPLLFHFPGDGHSGHIRSNAQLTDVAPTLLDYLGLDQPDWMSGSSLLEGEPERTRPIFSVFRLSGSEVRDKGLWWMDSGQLSPPFFSLGRVTVVTCNEWLALRLSDGVEQGGLIDGHSAPCRPDELPGPRGERSIIIEHLRSVGYDFSSLPQTN